MGNPTSLPPSPNLSPLLSPILSPTVALLARRNRSRRSCRGPPPVAQSRASMDARRGSAHNGRQGRHHRHRISSHVPPNLHRGVAPPPCSHRRTDRHLHAALTRAAVASLPATAWPLPELRTAASPRCLGAALTSPAIDSSCRLHVKR